MNCLCQGGSEEFFKFLFPFFSTLSPHESLSPPVYPGSALANDPNYRSRRARLLGAKLQWKPVNSRETARLLVRDRVSPPNQRSQTLPLQWSIREPSIVAQ